MPTTEFVFKSRGASTLVSDVKRIQAELKNSATATASFAKSLDLSFGEAQKFAKAIGLSAEKAGSAVSKIQQLNGVNATAAEKFEVLSRELKLNAAQFQILDNAVSNLTPELTGFQRIAGAIAATGLAVQVQQLGQQALATGLNFERLKTTLKTLLGSEGAAERAFEQIENFAATTPFQLDEVTQAYISLKQRGIEPTNEVLRRSGDIASSQGKSLQQFIEAILDATTGENERLKEFGVVARQAGDQVSFTFQGVTKTVEKTPQAISEALLAFGALQSVAGGMEEQSKTLGGAFSNLNDNIDKLANGLFELAKDPAIAVVQAANEFLNTFQALPAPIKLATLAIAGVGGAFVAAVSAITAFELANGRALVTQVAQSAALVKTTIQTNALAASQFLAAAATGKLTEAQIASASALAQTAAKAGLFAGAIAAVGLAVDTFRQVREEAISLEESAASVDEALQNLTATQATSADAAKAAAAATDLEAQALERAKEQIGSIQRALDVLRNILSTFSLQNLLEEFAKLEFVPQPIKDLINLLANALPEGIPGLSKLTTAAEANVNQQKIAFAELTGSVDGVIDKFNELKGKGLNLASKEELQAQKEAIDTAVQALEKSVPADQAAAASKKAYLEVLRRAKTELEGVNKAQEKDADLAGKAGDAYKEATDKIEAELLRRQAIIAEAQAEGLITEEEGQRQLTQVDQQSARNRIAAIRRYQRELKAAQVSTQDPEALKEINDAIAKADGDLAKERISIAKSTIAENKRVEQERKEAAEKAKQEQLKIEQERLDAVQEAVEKATGIVKQSEAERLIAIQKGLNAGVLAQEDADQQRLNSARDRIEQELSIERQRIALLQKLPQPNDPQLAEQREKEIRSARERTSQLALALLENEFQQQQKVKEVAIKAIERQEVAEKRRSDRQISTLQRELTLQGLVEQSLRRQGELLNSGLEVYQARESLNRVQNEAEFTNLERALEIRKQLDDETEESAAVRLQLERELTQLTGSSATQALDIIKRRQAREDQLARDRRASLLSELAVQRASLNLEEQRANLAARRSVSEAQLGVLTARKQQLEAEFELQKALASGDQDRIAIAREGVSIAQAQLDIARQTVAASIEDAEAQQQLLKNQRETLALEQEAKLAAEESAEIRRKNAQQLERVQAGGKADAPTTFLPVFDRNVLAELQRFLQERGGPATLDAAPLTGTLEKLNVTLADFIQQQIQQGGIVDLPKLEIPETLQVQSPELLSPLERIANSQQGTISAIQQLRTDFRGLAGVLANRPSVQVNNPPAVERQRSYDTGAWRVQGAGL